MAPEVVDELANESLFRDYTQAPSSSTRIELHHPITTFAAISLHLMKNEKQGQP